MAKFALLDNNIVLNIILIPDEYELNGADYIKSIGLEGTWVNAEKIYNNKKFFAGVGFSYNETYDVFIEPKPAPWFTFDDDNLEWTCPENINILTGEEFSSEEILLKQLKDDIIKQVKMQRLV